MGLIDRKCFFCDRSDVPVGFRYPFTFAEIDCPSCGLYVVSRFLFYAKKSTQRNYNLAKPENEVWKRGCVEVNKKLDEEGKVACWVLGEPVESPLDEKVVDNFKKAFQRRGIEGYEIIRIHDKKPKDSF